MKAPQRLPRIGISACFFHADPQRAVFKGKTLLYLEESMAHWMLSQGVMAYLIPSPATGGPPLRQFAQELDGLVLQGGSDVSPRSYGETPLRPEWSGDYVRDCYETELVREFIACDKPVLGICRGAQLLNVALGGTLYQDIGLQIPGAINHRDWEIYDQNFHEIEIVPGSGLSRLYAGRTRARINTVHHQALKDLGKGLTVEARSVADGIIEAVRLDPAEGRYAFAVQWHPEFQDPRDGALLDRQPIITEFLDEVRKRLC